MKRFTALFARLDQTTKTTEKVQALAEYFGEAPDQDRLWTIALLSGRRPKRTITTTQLRELAAEVAGIPLWLFEESYPVVGDLAETISLVLPPCSSRSDRSLDTWVNLIRSLSEKNEENRRTEIRKAWDQLDPAERFVFNKLITGGFRMGVSQKLMTRALSKATGIEESSLAHRLMGDWSPDNTSFENLITAPNPGADLSKPYPFYLAYSLDNQVNDLGSPDEWAAEYKWDGIRGQLVFRGGEHFCGHAARNL